MSLWVPAARPGEVESAARLADRLTSGLSPEAPKLASLVTSGWSGKAATVAATESSTLGKLLTQFCDRVSGAARAMHEFASTYGPLKARLVQLSAQHDAAQQRCASLSSAISGCSGHQLGPSDAANLRRMETQHAGAVDELRRLEQQHQIAMDEFTSAQQKTARQLDSLTPAGINGTPSQQSAQIKTLVLKEMPTVRYEDGRRLGDQIRKDIHDHGAATLAEIDALAANDEDPEFVKGLDAALGSSGVAALSRQARNGFAAGDRRSKDAAEKLRSALATSFTTAAGQGVITDDWLNKFDPKDANDLSKGLYSPGAEPSGFRADLLIPLVQEGRLPTSVLQAIGDHAFADLESGMDSGAPQVLDKWHAYGAGNADDPYRRNLMKRFLGSLSKDAEASNAVVLRNFDTLQRIGRNGMFSDVTKNIADPLAKVVDAGVLGVADLNHDGKRDTGPGATGFLGDALMSRIVLDTADHPKDHYTDFYRRALGSLVTNDRYFNDATYSVTALPRLNGPQHRNQWLDWDGRPYRDGIELDRSAWAAIHQEVMADAATATTIIQKTRQAMQEATNLYNSGKVPDPNNPGGTKADPRIRATDGMARNAMHLFLMQNLDAASGRLQDTLAALRAQEHGAQEAAKGAVHQIIDWAKDPTKIPGTMLTKTGDAVIDGLIHQSYSGEETDVQAALKGLDDARNSLHPDRLNDASSIYTANTDTWAADPGLVADIKVYDSHGVLHTYTGDPTPYIDDVQQHANYAGYGSPPTADFRDPSTHRPIPIDQMNQYQLEAYEKWLHDPAVQHQSYEGTAGLKDLANQPG